MFKNHSPNSAFSNREFFVRYQSDSQKNFVTFNLTMKQTYWHFILIKSIDLKINKNVL